jgi:hypothetical protein
MKFLLYLIMPFCSFAQKHPEFKTAENLFYKAIVFADSGTVKGYYVTSTDSAVILSSTKKVYNKYQHYYSGEFYPETAVKTPNRL